MTGIICLLSFIFVENVIIIAISIYVLKRRKISMHAKASEFVTME